MNPEMSKVVDEFVKNSPAAWASMCRYHQVQAIAEIGFFVMIGAILYVALRAIWRAELSNTDKGGASAALGIFVMAWACIGAAEVTSAWGTAFAPERDAAIDVLKMAGEK